VTFFAAVDRVSSGAFGFVAQAGPHRRGRGFAYDFETLLGQGCSPNSLSA